MRTWSLRLSAVLLLPVAALALASEARAQTEFPVKAIRLIAPVPPGSPPDIVARIFADALSQAFAQPVLVDNRPGANQTIGLGAVAASSPDGYTLGVVSLPTAVVPNLVAKMPYDTLRDFSPVREVAWTSNVLVVKAGSEVRSVQDLVAAARARPGKITFASGGNGTPAHVTGELFREQAGLDMLHVPFKGAVEGVNAVIAGDVDFMLASAGTVASQVRAGRLRALAQTTQSRLPLLPEVATFAELGFSGIDVRDWQGIVAPANTPPAVLVRLSTAMRDAVLRPEVQERLRKLGMEPVQHSDPQDFGVFLGAELKRWAAVARASGLQAQ
jgi:tripartite-type tricarboxylate transporter receptor subunit TctC